MTVNKKVWTKPEMTVASASEAKVGNNSQLIDQGFPAMNGTTAHFS